MLKKIFSIRFFTIILILLLFAGCSSVFASSESYSFNDFDGNTYTLPALPDLSEYKHYIIIDSSTSNKVSSDFIHLFVFNDKLDITRDDSLRVIVDSDISVKYRTTRNGSSWTSFGQTDTGYTISLSKEPKIINSSVDLLHYGNDFNSEEGFFLIPPTTEMEGVLAPIVQETEMKKVLQEIIQIIPIVLLILVGLIGLRKALAMLFKVLHQS